jgi:hypothetical protein
MRPQLKSTSTRLGTILLCSIIGSILILPPARAADRKQPAWGAAQRIDASQSANPPLIVADKKGNAIAIWTQPDAAPQQYGLWANRYTVGQGWGKPGLINDYIGEAWAPMLAINEQGEAIAAWVQLSLFDESNPSAPLVSTLWTNRFDPAKGWAKPEQIRDAVNNPGDARVAIDNDGNAIVVWDQTNVALDIPNVYGKRYSKRAGWDKARRLQRDSASWGSLPELAMNDNGVAMVEWSQMHPTTPATFDVAFTRYLPGTGWTRADVIPEAGTGVKIAVDEQGAAMAAWSANDATFQPHVFVSRYNARHGWDKPERLDAPLQDGSADHVRLTMNDKGEAFALWNELIAPLAGSFSFEIHASRYVVGKGWDGDQKVGITATYPEVQMNAQIGIDGQGNATAVWEQENSAELYLYPMPATNMLAFHYTVGKGWDAGQTIQTGTDPAGFASIAVTENGDVFAAWQQQDQTTYDYSLWANRYAKP